MASTDALVVGGGVAGLAAATALAGKGARVVLLERRPHLGGRAYSFHDPRLGEDADNGQHLFMGCYRQTREFLGRIRAQGLLKLPGGVKIAYLDARGESDLLHCPAFLPAPLHLAFGVARLRGIGWAEKASLSRLAGFFRRLAQGPLSPEFDRVTARSWLDSLGLGRGVQRLLIDPIALGALNEPPERASALGLIAVLREVFFRDEESSRLGLAAAGLSKLLAEPARRFIEARGGLVHCSRTVVSLEREGFLWRARTERGEVFSARRLISALPPWALSRVGRPAALRGPWEGLEASPIIAVHLKLDRPVAAAPVIGLLGMELHWIFDKTALWGLPGPGQYLSLVISAARSHAAKTPAELLSLARAELAGCLGAFAKAKIEAWSVVKEPRATPALLPGTDAARPDHRSPEPGFFFAGDWTRTGLPATIESAVQSGHACAALASEG